MSSGNEVVVKRWWEELWNQGNLTVADEIVAPDFSDHDPASPWVPPGIDGCKTLVTGYRTVFPDIHFTIEQQVAADETVVSHWRCRGTHRGDLMGVAPTGKNIEVEGISILRLQNGKIQHQTTIWDALGLMQQIGAVPPLGEPAVT
jgi:steroid delta-isomerase-like uncharacterized protein